MFCGGLVRTVQTIYPNYYIIFYQFSYNLYNAVIVWTMTVQVLMPLAANHQRFGILISSDF